MSRSASRLSAIFLALVLLLAGGAGLALWLDGPRGHLQGGDCGGCHLAGRNVAPAQAGMLVASQEALCGKCHPASVRLSHPSGFRPAAKLPDAWPLDWKGDLTCSTCHEVHGEKPGLMRGAKVGRDLCLSCHDAAFFRRMRDGGASLMVGHLGSGIDSKAPLLDPYSRQCMECHGNSGDARIQTRVDRNGVARHAGSAMNHPVGADYQKATAFGGYKPRRAVEAKLLLPGGMVSCVSCHAGYQKDHGKLVVTRAGSKLCYECHDL